MVTGTTSKKPQKSTFKKPNHESFEFDKYLTLSGKHGEGLGRLTLTNNKRLRGLNLGDLSNESSTTELSGVLDRSALSRNDLSGISGMKSNSETYSRMQNQLQTSGLQSSINQSVSSQQSIRYPNSQLARSSQRDVVEEFYASPNAQYMNQKIKKEFNERRLLDHRSPDLKNLVKERKMQNLLHDLNDSYELLLSPSASYPDNADDIFDQQPQQYDTIRQSDTFYDDTEQPKFHDTQYNPSDISQLENEARGLGIDPSNPIELQPEEEISQNSSPPQNINDNDRFQNHSLQQDFENSIVPNSVLEDLNDSSPDTPREKPETPRSEADSINFRKKLQTDKKYSLHELSVKSIKNIHNRKVQLGNLSVLYGKHNCGKSTILSSLTNLKTCLGKCTSVACNHSSTFIDQIKQGEIRRWEYRFLSEDQFEFVLIVYKGWHGRNLPCIIVTTEEREGQVLQETSAGSESDLQQSGGVSKLIVNFSKLQRTLKDEFQLPEITQFGRMLQITSLDCGNLLLPKSLNTFMGRFDLSSTQNLSEIKHHIFRKFSSIFPSFSISENVFEGKIVLKENGKPIELSHLGTGVVQLLVLLEQLLKLRQKLKQRTKKCNILLLENLGSNLQGKLTEVILKEFQTIQADHSLQILGTTINSDVLTILPPQQILYVLQTATIRLSDFSIFQTHHPHIYWKQLDEIENFLIHHKVVLVNHDEDIEILSNLMAFLYPKEWLTLKDQIFFHSMNGKLDPKNVKQIENHFDRLCKRSCNVLSVVSSQSLITNRSDILWKQQNHFKLSRRSLKSYLLQKKSLCRHFGRLEVEKAFELAYNEGMGKPGDFGVYRDIIDQMRAAREHLVDEKEVKHQTLKFLKEHKLNDRASPLYVSLKTTIQNQFTDQMINLHIQPLIESFLKEKKLRLQYKTDQIPEQVLLQFISPVAFFYHLDQELSTPTYMQSVIANRDLDIEMKQLAKTILNL